MRSLLLRLLGAVVLAGLALVVLAPHATAQLMPGRIRASQIVSGIIGVVRGGTGAATLTAHGFLVGEATSAVAATAACGTGTVAYGQGASADPVCSTTTWPNSATQGDLLTATGANAVGSVAAVATGQVLTSAGTSTVPAYSATPSITSLTVKAGSGTDTLKAGGTIATGNVTADTATQNLWNVILIPTAASDLATVGDSLHLTVGILAAANTNTHEYQVYWSNTTATCSGSGATLCDTGCAVLSSLTNATSSAQATFNADVVRTGSSTQFYIRNMTGTPASNATSTCSVTDTGTSQWAIGYRNTSAAAATIGRVTYLASYFGK